METNTTTVSARITQDPGNSKIPGSGRHCDIGGQSLGARGVELAVGSEHNIIIAVGVKTRKDGRPTTVRTTAVTSVRVAPCRALLVGLTAGGTRIEYTIEGVEVIDPEDLDENLLSARFNAVYRTAVR